MNLQPTIDFVTNAHAGQFRKGIPLPYIVHPFAVLYEIAIWGVQCEDCWKAALSHDILEENAKISVDELKNVIGEKATNIVQELTFLPEQGDKRKYMESFLVKSPAAIVIKMSDRICNTADFLDTLPAKDLSYAGKYWNKAESLFVAALSRRDEIVQCFGTEVWARMRFKQNKINQRILEEVV